MIDLSKQLKREWQRIAQSIKLMCNKQSNVSSILLSFINFITSNKTPIFVILRSFLFHYICIYFVGEELQCPSNEPSGDEDGDEDKDQYDMKDVDEVKGDDEEMKTISDQENKLEQMNENRDLNGDDDLDDPNKERIQPITVNRIIFCSRF
ncbi:unnamed protein product [Rotaria sp. Silwood2]|nr:unnamed protein product [Rotaria sp. Silwood2]